jgi:hypothetical protein
MKMHGDDDSSSGRRTLNPARRAFIGAVPPFAAGAAVLAQAAIPAQAQPGAAPDNVRSILELLSPQEIEIVRGKENSTNLLPKIQTAMSANPGTTWFWPAGWYWLDANVPLSLPPGIRWIGAGPGATNIKIGAAPWGIQQLSAKGTNAVRGFSAHGITFLFSNNGIRLNSADGGYDDTAASQHYILAPVFERCEFLFNGAPNNKTMLQFNKCFNGGVSKSKFSGGHVQADFRGSDICWLTHNRLDVASDCAVQVLSFGTFGSSTLVHHNDINNPKNSFYRGNDRDGKFTDNHCELDFPPRSSGAGGKQQAAIDIIPGNAFQTLIANNRMEVEVYAERWLRYRSSNPYMLVVENNGSSGPANSQTDIGSLPYFTNSGTRMICAHRNNHVGDHTWPMNYEAPDGVRPGAVAAFLTASRPHVTNAGLGQTLRCLSGDFIMGPDPDPGKYLEWSDWSGLPANRLVGNFTIVATTYGGVAGQTLHYAILDNGRPLSGGTIAHGTANRYYNTVLGTNLAVGAKLQIRVWNQDSRGAAYIRAVEVRFA